MRIFTIGATGHTGTQIIDLALSRGHEVTAFVHRRRRFTVKMRGFMSQQATLMASNN